MTLFSETREGLVIAWAAIRANKLRSVLTTLGIVIGIITVTLMGTAITGLNRSFMQSISSIGADVLYVSQASWFIESEQEWEDSQKRPAITLYDETLIENQMTLAKAVAPIVSTMEPIKYGRQSSSSVSVVGTSDQYQITSGFTMKDGRFLSAVECDYSRPVCVIGADVATNLFRHGEAVGQSVQLNRRPFEVIGVLEKQGGFSDENSPDNQVIIPLSQFTYSFSEHPDYTIAVKVRDLDEVDDAKEELRTVMRRARHIAPGQPDNFAINQQDQILQLFHRVAGTIGAIGLFITGLSLFVGGIGIMNIMFVSVAERTREIGVRKAIGAKSRTILLQFLIEAACICLLGGLIALMIAWPATLLLQRMMPATLSPFVVGVSLLVSALTGILSGFLPAWRAARMNPVDALRNE
jgi:putative ABC transport system permease protein